MEILMLTMKEFETIILKKLSNFVSEKGTIEIISRSKSIIEDGLRTRRVDIEKYHQLTTFIHITLAKTSRKILLDKLVKSSDFETNTSLFLNTLFTSPENIQILVNNAFSFIKDTLSDMRLDHVQIRKQFVTKCLSAYANCTVKKRNISRTDYIEFVIEPLEDIYNEHIERVESLLNSHTIANEIIENINKFIEPFVTKQETPSPDTHYYLQALSKFMWININGLADAYVVSYKNGVNSFFKEGKDDQVTFQKTKIFDESLIRIYKRKAQCLLRNKYADWRINLPQNALTIIDEEFEVKLSDTISNLEIVLKRKRNYQSPGIQLNDMDTSIETKNKLFTLLGFAIHQI